MAAPASHDDYLEGLGAGDRAALEALRTEIAAALPGAEEVISYGLPGFRLRGRMIAGYAANRRFLSFYPHSGGILPAMADELAALGFSHTKSALHFAPARPIPVDLLRRILNLRRVEAGV